MAGANHPKFSHHHHQSNKPSSSHRKSRWESAPNPPADPKSGDPKPSSNPDSNPNRNNNNSKNKLSNPSPKLLPNPSPARPKPSNEPNPPPGPAPFPLPDPSSIGPPPPPAYGFHMLERRTILLADRSVRTYFALPPDYQDFQPPLPMDFPGGRFPHPAEMGGPGMDRRFAAMSPEGFRDDQFARGRQQDYWNSLGLEGRAQAEGSMKRKYLEEERKDRRDDKDEFGRQRQQLLQYGNPNQHALGDRSAGTSSPYHRRDAVDINRGDEFRSSKMMRMAGGGACYDNVGLKHLEVDQNLLHKAFLHFVKLVNESASQRKSYLEDGKQGRLKCIACTRSSKDFPDMHGLIMHTYNMDNADLRVNHLGLHKALCVLMGWNYSQPPDNSKSYQFLPAAEAAANRDDLIMWPPLVIIHNTNTGKSRDGQMEGLGNKAMDNKIRDIGFGAGKSKSLYGRDGHLGITLVKFNADQTGLKDAVRLAEYFERDNHGRKSWSNVQPLGKDDDRNPNLVRVDDRTGERTKILYGYLGTAADLDKVDFDTRKKVVIESRREQRSFR